ncbi:MAG: hypothetical protein KUG81_01870 [Gammaproteobacteria bacterium]|nr:hypothetical protein [Gammaproteobacteria bacterium]
MSVLTCKGCGDGFMKYSGVNEHACTHSCYARYLKELEHEREVDDTLNSLNLQTTLLQRRLAKEIRIIYKNMRSVPSRVRETYTHDIIIRFLHAEIEGYEERSHPLRKFIDPTNWDKSLTWKGIKEESEVSFTLFFIHGIKSKVTIDLAEVKRGI